jgi:hypothetical protein
LRAEKKAVEISIKQNTAEIYKDLKAKNEKVEVLVTKHLIKQKAENSRFHT